MKRTEWCDRIATVCERIGSRSFRYKGRCYVSSSVFDGCEAVSHYLEESHALTRVCRFCQPEIDVEGGLLAWARVQLRLQGESYIPNRVLYRVDTDRVDAINRTMLLQRPQFIARDVVHRTVHRRRLQPKFEQSVLELEYASQP